LEKCPRCGDHSAVRAKLVLIDEAWVPAAGKAHEAYHQDVRVDDLEPDRVRAAPLEQFVDGCYCESCGIGYVPDDALKPGHRHQKRD